MKKLIACLLSLSLVLTSSAFALESTNNSQSRAPFDETNLIKISYKDLPTEFQSFVQPSASIYMDSNGDYSIVQTPQIAPYGAMERNEPRGGTYTDFQNAYINNELLIISQSYVPNDAVLNWAVGTTQGAVESILGWGAAGIAVEAIATKFAVAYGFSIPIGLITTILTTGQVAHYALTQLDKQLALESNARSGGKGIDVKYVMGVTSYRFARIYEPWSNFPYVPTYPNGGTASWQSGSYGACN